MSVISNRPIAMRIALIAFVPLLAAIVMGYASLSRDWDHMRSSQSVEQHVATSQKIASLVHELQRERGMSAGFLASDGVKFSNQLAGQERLTDRALSQARADMQDGTALAEAINLISDLKLMRERRASKEASIGEVTRFYTAAVGKLIHAMGEGARGSDDLRIVNALETYLSMARMKEKAGLERAMGAVGFGSGRFDRKTYERFVGLRTAQDVHQDAFLLSASTALKGKLASAMAGDDAQGVFAMRELASVDRDRAESAVDPENWWARISAKIDTLREVEQSAGVELADAAAARSSLARGALFLKIAVIFAVFAATVAATAVVTKGITGPIAALKRATHRMAGGELDTEIGVAETKDEIGSLASSIRIFRERLLDGERQREAHRKDRENNLRLAEERSRKVEDLAGHFDSDMTGAMTVFGSSVETLMQAADELDRRASEASERSTAVAAASQQTNTNVQIVASATEELSLSIEEIFAQVRRTSEDIGKAATEATAANAEMKALDTAARQIDEVVRLIADIAEQTNVLALNATIEAARAGAEGAGFAVVASEVRSLAEETAKATAEISATVAAVAEKSSRAAKSMESINGTIRDVELAGTAMSAALDQQGAAARNIARSVQEAANGVEQVDANIAEIEQTSSSARNQVKSVVAAATQFQNRASSVRGSVDQFLTSIKAA